MPVHYGDSGWPEPDAPGSPGIPPTWTSSSKEFVGASLRSSRLWFTIGYGIVNEVYYPRVDLPQIRDLGFIVADGAGFWSEVKRLNNYELVLPGQGIPAAQITHRHERYTLALRIVPDEYRDVLLIEAKLEGEATLRPYVLLAPHLGGTGNANMAACDQHYGRRVLWAEQGPFGLALAAVSREQTEALQRGSAGYVGFSDGWQDFDRNGAMSWEHARSGPGNVALLGELERDCVLALGFGSSRGAAASLAVSALARPFDQAWHGQVGSWKRWHEACANSALAEPRDAKIAEQLATSRTVLRCHMDKTYPGAMVASLSIPWGNTRDDRGGYHLVWPRDLVQCATALLAAGGDAEARDALRYLIATQYEDGHWNQNQWLGGSPFWQGVQLDEAALPVLLAALLEESGVLAGIQVTDMVSRALGFIARMGPVSDQDRWEEDRGINTYTLATCIAALVCGSELVDATERPRFLALADRWNEQIETWLFSEDSPLARQFGVTGHYVRAAPPEILSDRQAFFTVLPIKNQKVDPALRVNEQISCDFLQLVRYGLRKPDDPRILDSLKVVDALLKVTTPSGPGWYRYNRDGYGERADGSEFDGAGQGRLWPLLTGERGHYEVLAGNDAVSYLDAMCAMAGAGGMLPEQIWDGDPIPAKRLQPGRPTGSAMPLAWAHAEFIKLFLANHLGRVVDCPRCVFDRYANPAS